MHIVVYRPHNSLMCETKSIGPFGTWDEAYDYLCNMPALGQYIPDGTLNNPGVKFVDRLEIPTLTLPGESK